ncbi:protein of unknown function [Microbacterium sp. Nx66]|nr:protein of unknown function [Microbacterium sp. Nx66]
MSGARSPRQTSSGCTLACGIPERVFTHPREALPSGGRIRYSDDRLQCLLHASSVWDDEDTFSMWDREASAGPEGSGRRRVRERGVHGLGKTGETMAHWGYLRTFTAQGASA